MIPDWLEAFVIRCLAAVARAAAFVPDETDVYARAITDTAEVIEVPFECRGAWVLLGNTSGEAVFVRFGTSLATTINPSATSTIETVSRRIAGADGAPHLMVPAGQSIPVLISKRWRYLAHVVASADSTGSLTMTRAEPALAAFEVRP